jgi:TRAP-type C4-dicarboxylate transport system permease small subunit
MLRKRTRRLFGTLVALVVIVAGGVLIYSGWQSKPGREEILALGITMTVGGLVFVVWFGR